LADEKDTITISKDTLWKFTAFTLFGFLVVSVFTGGFGFKDNDKSITGQAVQVAAPTRAVPNAAAGNPNAAAPQPRLEVSLDGAFMKGDKNAPVTMVEFSDFQCPFCGRFFTQTFPQIKSEYIDTGKLQFYYKDFPLDSIHPQATPAAIAARCAGEQGTDKFWEFHDKLFVGTASNLNDANYRKYAADIGLDINKFNGCLDSQKYINEVKTDLQEGQDAGIRGTPGFLVAGQLVSGAQPFTAFQQIIDAELARVS